VEAEHGLDDAQRLPAQTAHHARWSATSSRQALITRSDRSKLVAKWQVL
jgi:hypothetical protein